MSTFAEAGYESSNFFELLGPICFIVVGFVALVILRPIVLRLTQSVKDKNCLCRLVHQRVNYRIIILIFILEGCIEIGLSAAIAVTMVS